MKKTFLKFMPLLAVLSFAGCASEESVTDEPDDSKNLSCISVNIVQPKDATVRADGTGETWEDGKATDTTEENGAKNAIFCIFDKDGKFYGENKFIEAEIKGTGTTSSIAGEEKIYKALVVIKESKENPVNQAKKLVCFLNLTEDQLNELENKANDLSSLMSIVSNYETGEKIGNKNSLVMSNAVYIGKDKNADGSEITERYTYTKIKEENLAVSANEAEKNPVNVYVERVVAKVRAHAKNGTNGAAEFTNTEGAKVIISGDTEASRTYAIKITGIEVANVADKAYIGKQIGNDAAFGDYWNQETNHRYNWEVMPKKGSYGYKNQSYNQIVGKDAAPTDKAYPKLDIEGLTKDNPFTQYILPNTSDQKTSILVTAQLVYKEGAEAGNPVGTFVYLRGFYYLEDDAKQVVAKYLYDLGYCRIKDGTESNPEYEAIDGNDIAWAWSDDTGKYTWLKDYEVVPEVTSGKDIYKKTSTTGGYAKCDLSEVNNLLKYGATTKPDDAVLQDQDQGPYYRARVFTDGLCYYFENIKHDLVSTAGADRTTASTQYVGVVRNHIYDLSLNSIGGLGVPVCDPDKPIIPENPDTKYYYLNADVTVLSWRVKTQEVNFTGN